MNYNWNWGVLFIQPYAGWILTGLQLTLVIACTATVAAFSLGAVVGVLRTVEARLLRHCATAYVELFRNVPLLVQMFLWFFVLPELLPASWGHYLKRELPHPEVITAIVCLAFYQAARVAETVRAGIESIRRGQTLAGLAIGLTPIQVYWYVILPVTLRIIVPDLTNIFLGTVKDSSLALTIGVLELTAQSRQIEVYTFQGFEAFFAATLLYQAITVAVIYAMQYVERRARVPGMASLAER